MSPKARAARRYVLKIAAVHDGRLPWEWTTRVYLHAMRLLGPNRVQASRWTVESLNQPSDRMNAALAAIEADILVVSLSATRELPNSINRWVDSWLPYRPERAGLLMAILGVPQQPGHFLSRIHEYFHDVASVARLDLLPRQRLLPAAHPGVVDETTAEDSERIVQVISQVRHHHHGFASRAYSRGGFPGVSCAH